ncbi:hypothetical protein [Flammeovirga kamogawensis]|uniref:Uncharacterized protein n=1 Tax=Flammeovirga kamogawensis TaxID=373891 RepID=A0ABX8H2I4_9BACT|nr:hypothetical protein [Flammeovirga kamogawensis]MBB6460317.1 hypothetical protein [Flammeovirga kamogawensis]QWG10126.1 hypothetical protein KM029_20810 [Flammeovirga kamogawensis]TRX65635.1 hypothetical protein EO216_24245 [Flammeovirga kamogawensis]
MLIRKKEFIQSSIVFLISIYLTISNANILNIEIISSIRLSLGTLINWAGIVALPLMIYYGNNSINKPILPIDFQFKSTNKFLIGYASLWGIVSYLLTNTWSFTLQEMRQSFNLSFDNSNGLYWINTISVLLLPILFFIVYKLNTLKKK